MSKRRKKIKVEIVQDYGPKQQDSFWYEGHVGSVSRGGITVNIEANGDIRILNKKHGLVHDGYKERDAGFPEFKNGLKTDRQLRRLEKLGYEWDNNNWFESFVSGNLVDSGDAGEVSDTLKNAIATAKKELIAEENRLMKEALESIANPKDK